MRAGDEAARARLAAEARDLEASVRQAKQTFLAEVEAATAKRDAVYLKAARFGWSYRAIALISGYAHQAIGAMVGKARLREARQPEEERPQLRRAA